MIDLTKAVRFSSYPAFKNNNVYTGSITIPSTTITQNTASYEFTVLTQGGLDIADVLFRGPTNGLSSRPDDSWVTPGAYGFVVQTGTQSSFPFNNIWYISYRIESGSLKIRVDSTPLSQAFGSFIPSGTVTVDYRIVDYSAL